MLWDTFYGSLQHVVCKGLNIHIHHGLDQQINLKGNLKNHVSQIKIWFTNMKH